MKKRILVVEDEVIIADDLCNSLEELGYETIEPAINYTEAITLINQEKPDLIILDIQLSGKKSGIDIAKKIRNEYAIPYIFLTSNSDKYTFLEAKEVRPQAFLAKPFKQDDLYSAIEIALANFKDTQEDKSNFIFVKTNKGLQKIILSNILYVKSDHVYLQIYFSNGKQILIRKSITDFLKELNTNFVRIHRSYVVNITKINKFTSSYVTIGEKEIPISKSYKDELFNKLTIIS